MIVPRIRALYMHPVQIPIAQNVSRSDLRSHISEICRLPLQYFHACRVVPMRWGISCATMPIPISEPARACFLQLIVIVILSALEYPRLMYWPVDYNTFIMTLTTSLFVNLPLHWHQNATLQPHLRLLRP